MPSITTPTPMLSLALVAAAFLTTAAPSAQAAPLLKPGSAAAKAKCTAVADQSFFTIAGTKFSANAAGGGGNVSQLRSGYILACMSGDVEKVSLLCGPPHLSMTSEAESSKAYDKREATCLKTPALINHKPVFSH